MNNIDIRITANDLASDTISKVKGQISGLSTTVIDLGKKSAIALTAMGASMTVLANKAGTFSALQSGFARNFGDVTTSIETLRKSARGTVSDFDLMQTANRAALLGVTNSAEKLAVVMQVATVRGREMGLSTTQAFNDIVTGIGRGSPLILDNLGIKIPDALVKATESMDETSKQQALLNFVMNDGKKILEEYGEVPLTVADRLQIAKAQVENLTVAMGSTLAPIIDSVSQTFAKIVGNITKFVSENKKTIAIVAVFAGTFLSLVAIIGLATKAFILIKTAVLAFAAASRVTQLSLGLLGVGLFIFSTLVTKAATDQMEFNDSVSSGADQMKQFAKNASTAGTTMSDAMKKSKEKVKELADAIREENEAFEEQMSEIVTNAKARIQENRESLEQEKADFDKAQAEKKKQYEKQTAEQKKQNRQRIADLETSMGKSVVIGSKTYTQDVKKFEAMIEDEKQAGEEKLREMEAQYAQDTQNAEMEMKKKTSALEKKIMQDEEMLRKHSEQIKNIKTKESKDEIDILIETHNKRLQKLKEELAKEEKASKDSAQIIKNTFEGMDIDWDKSFDSKEMVDPVSKAVNDIQIFIGRGFAGIDMFYNYIKFKVINALMDLTVKTAEFVNNSPIASILKAIGINIPATSTIKVAAKATKLAAAKDYYDSLDRLLAYDKTYGLDKSYAVGTKYVYQDTVAKVHKGEMVMPASEVSKMEQGKENNVTINNYFSSVETSPELVSSRLNFQLKGII